MMVAVPARHPLLAHKRMPHWKNCCAIRWCCAIRRRARAMPGRLIVCCTVWTWNTGRRAGGVLRPDDGAGIRRFRAGPDRSVAYRGQPGTRRRCTIAGRALALLTTYLLRLDGDPSETLARFIERVQAIESPEVARPTSGHCPDPRKNPSHEEGNPAAIGRGADRMRTIRNSQAGQRANRRGTGRRSCAPERVAPTVQD